MGERDVEERQLTKQVRLLPLKHHADAADQDALQAQGVGHSGGQHGGANVTDAHAGQARALDLLAVGDEPVDFLCVDGRGSWGKEGR